MKGADRSPPRKAGRETKGDGFCRKNVVEGGHVSDPCRDAFTDFWNSGCSLSPGAKPYPAETEHQDKSGHNQPDQVTDSISHHDRKHCFGKDQA